MTIFSTLLGAPPRGEGQSFGFLRIQRLFDSDNQGNRREGIKRVVYVDIDAHHGDGAYYGFTGDPSVIIADIHEDGRSLFPGTGDVSETRKGTARGTKMNIPLRPGSGDTEFIEAFDAAYRFLTKFDPEFVFFQR